MVEACKICEGRGMRVIERTGGIRFAQECECRVALRVERQAKQARIPKRYEHCDFESFTTDFTNADPSLIKAKLMAENFAKAWPVESDGLLFHGTIGVGKTHLATSVLKEVLTRTGGNGIFYDYRELLKAIQNTYDKSVAETEKQVLEPVLQADILVLDELGAAKPSEWVWDMVALILNSRYNDRRTTIITSNFANLPPGEGTLTGPRAAVREETLGDRIGERMRSRLQEMCAIIPMSGVDFRQTVKRVHFGQSKAKEAVMSALGSLGGENGAEIDTGIGKRMVASGARKTLSAAGEDLSFVSSLQNEEESVVGAKRLGRFARSLDVSGRD
jgi:DNA replication protein DnaC